MSKIDDLLFRSSMNGRAESQGLPKGAAELPGAVRGLALAILLGSLAWAAVAAVVLA